MDVEKKEGNGERREGLSTHRQSRLKALWPEGDKDTVVLKVLFAYVEVIVPTFHHLTMALLTTKSLSLGRRNTSVATLLFQTTTTPSCSTASSTKTLQHLSL